MNEFCANKKNRICYKNNKISTISLIYWFFNFSIYCIACGYHRLLKNLQLTGGKQTVKQHDSRNISHTISQSRAPAAKPAKQRNKWTQVLLRLYIVIIHLLALACNAPQQLLISDPSLRAPKAHLQWWLYNVFTHFWWLNDSKIARRVKYCPSSHKLLISTKTLKNHRISFSRNKVFTGSLMNWFQLTLHFHCTKHTKFVHINYNSQNLKHLKRSRFACKCLHFTFDFACYVCHRLQFGAN